MSVTRSSLIAACYDKSCAPPPAGKGGSSPKGAAKGVQGPSKKMSDPVIGQWRAFMKRTEPGRGKDAPDDGAGPAVKNKSIPNVSTPRLKRAAEHLSKQIHTKEGLHSFDQPKRSLVHTGTKLMMIRHELRLRGEA